MRLIKFFSSILIIGLISGCQVWATKPTATMIPATETTTNAGSNDLTLEQFKNFSFMSPSLQQEVQLVDGKFESNSGGVYESMHLLDQAAFGDLNGDGSADAAVLLAENTGGSGDFIYLVALIKQADGFSQSIPQLIDDRPLIESLSINNNRIRFVGTIHGLADAMVNPTMKVTEEFQLTHSKLTLTRMNSIISGAERSITIDTPLDNSEVSGTFNVKGSMPIGPFENTLTYRFYDVTGNLLVEGPLMVNSDGAGGPATIDANVNLPQSNPGSRLIFVLAEQSMADGSNLCLNSVNLVVK